MNGTATLKFAEKLKCVRHYALVYGDRVVTLGSPGHARFLIAT